MSDKKIGVATRLDAASFEMCTRISIRNNTLLHFSAFSSVMLGYSLIGGESAAIISVAIPYLSLFVVLLSTYHERTIYKLAEFQARVTATDDRNVPNWYSEDFYFSLRPQRMLRDWAHMYIIFPMSLGALLLIYSRWDSYPLHYRNSYLIAVVIACLSLTAAAGILLFNMYEKGRLLFFQSAQMEKDSIRRGS